MSMVKVVDPGAYDFGNRTGRVVKIAAGGLRGNDLSEFIKSANHKFVDVLRDWSPDSGEVPVHFIAIGATERYGANRNFDGFRRDPCREQHHTFVKHARFYRSHKNKDPRESYGYIKASVYNEDMDRIEVLVSLLTTKQAAERHGGLVADKEMDKLSSDRDLPVSMASLVPFDRCSSCRHEAKTREEYCLGVDEGGHCERGGLRHKIGRLCDDGHLLHADNPINRWFDLSHVFRPADRIAFALGKAADAGAVDNRPALLLEEAPARVLGDAGIVSEAMQKQSEWLAAAPPRLADSELAASPLAEPAVCPRGVKLSHALRALADERVVLPVSEFLRLIGASARDEDLRKLAACAATATLDCQTLAAELLCVPALYQPRREPAAPAVRQWARKLAESYSDDPRWAARRLWRLALRRVENPADAAAEYLRLQKRAAASAVCSELAEELASHYRRYCAAAKFFGIRLAF